MAGCRSNLTIPPTRGLAGAAPATYIFKLACSFSGKSGKAPGAFPVSDPVWNHLSKHIFGTTSQGGAKDVGTIFGIGVPSDHFVLIHSFAVSDGAYPTDAVTIEFSKVATILFTTTSFGGLHDEGAAVEDNSAGSYRYKLRTIHDFDKTDGDEPESNPLPGSVKGTLYGTALGGGKGGSGGNGTLFQVKQRGSKFVLTTLHFFSGSPDGQSPSASLILDTKGDVFGTTISGGTNNMGGIYEYVRTTGREKMVHSFAGGSDGAYPHAGLIVDKSGGFFGTTTNGGPPNVGTVFVLKPSGTTYKESVIYSFAASGDGQYPYGRLLLGSGGVLYGTTEGGGTAGLGTVFELSPKGAKYTETILHSFSGAPHDGANPEGGLIDVNGVLYGTTYGGGTSNLGTVFSLTP